jgi:hypothetical protein
MEKKKEKKYFQDREKERGWGKKNCLPKPLLLRRHVKRKTPLKTE